MVVLIRLALILLEEKIQTAPDLKDLNSAEECLQDKGRGSTFEFGFHRSYWIHSNGTIIKKDCMYKMFYLYIHPQFCKSSSF